jgi:two-component system nitrogen regulation response regulator GlnG
MDEILIIDDNKYFRFSLSEVVQEYGFKPLTASDCEEGRKLLNSSKPRLIILDKKLPDGDGIEMLKEIKQMNGYKDIPVIMLTAYSSNYISGDAFKYGSYAVFSKPFNITEIAETIKKALGTK